MKVSLESDGKNLILRFPYDVGLVAAVKSLPVSDRRWDKELKAWIIDPDSGPSIVNTIAQITGQRIKLPAVIKPETETRILSVWYIGRCKDRNGEKVAYGMLDNDEWGVVFPENTLREWFDAGEAHPNEQSNLFSVLGVSRSASVDEIRNGYRKMVKIWHPDVNRMDSDAAEQFLRIQEAWEILSNDYKKERYIAGLTLEESLRADGGLDTEYFTGGIYEYRSPLRCGVIMAEGVEKTGRFVVSKILAWQDVYNQDGLMMVTRWAAGATKPEINWV